MPIEPAQTPAITEDDPGSSERIDSLVRPLVESAEQAAAPPEPAPVDPAPAESALAEPALAEPAPAEPPPLEVSHQESPSIEPEPLLSSPALPDSTALAEALEQDAQAVLEAISPRPQPAETAADLFRASEVQAQIVLDSIAQQLETERAAIGVILASFSEKPTTRLLGAPEEVVTAPAPPFLEWIRTARPVIVPAEAQDPAAASFSIGPQSPTLNGPCLPPQLKNLTENQTAQQRPSKSRNHLPTLMVSCLIATGLLLGAVSLIQYLSAERDAKPAAAAASVPTPSRSASAAPIDSAPAEHPWSRLVEVAGIRVISGANHRPQLQYIIINHSSKELTGLGIRLALRSGNDPPSSTPLFTVFSKVPALGAYQSREIRTDLDADLRASSLSDWQSLRSDVQVSGQQ